jgi:hypothetical protein
VAVDTISDFVPLVVEERTLFSVLLRLNGDAMSLPNQETS